MTAPKKTPEAPVVPVGDVSDAEKELRTKSYAYASRVLREENEDYFNKLRTEFLERNGITGWEPESVIAKRKAEAKHEADRIKATARLEKLYEQFPELRPAAPAVAEGTEAPPEG